MGAETRTSAPSVLGGRVDTAAVRTYLPGDLVAILAFVVAGELRHGYAPLAQPLHVAGTAVPFLVGWAVAATLAGAYGRRTLQAGRSLLATTAVAWLGADVVAQALRATPFFHGDAALAFFLVSLGVGGILLAGWRGVRFLLR